MNALQERAHRVFDHGVSRLVVVHFPEGAFALQRDGEKCFLSSHPIPHGEIAGTNGAGDAFCTSVLYGVHKKNTCVSGRRAAADSAGQEGAALPPGMAPPTTSVKTPPGEECVVE